MFLVDWEQDVQKGTPIHTPSIVYKGAYFPPHHQHWWCFSSVTFLSLMSESCILQHFNLLPDIDLLSLGICNIPFCALPVHPLCLYFYLRVWFIWGHGLCFIFFILVVCLFIFCSSVVHFHLLYH